MENLSGVSAEIAAAKPVNNAHSIWEIVNHAAAWHRAVIEVMDGSSYVTLTGDADWPPMPDDRGEEAWAAAVENLATSHKGLCERLIAVEDEKLRERVPGVDYSWKALLHGIKDHNLYHAGQIGLLKRAVE